MSEEDPINTTTATARLPGLDIEIVHRRSPGGNAEQLSINLQATPSFEAFVSHLEAANPLVFWSHLVQLAWFPWLMVGRTALPGFFVSAADEDREAPDAPERKQLPMP